MIPFGSLFNNGRLSFSFIVIVSVALALAGLCGCGETEETDPITLDEVNSCTQEISIAHENAFDECTVDNGTVGSYTKMRNASSTLFIEGSNVMPKTRKWLFRNYTDPLTGYSANGTIDEVWGDAYTGSCEITWKVTRHPALHITGTKSKTSEGYSGTFEINGTSFDAASVLKVLTGSH